MSKNKMASGFLGRLRAWISGEDGSIALIVAFALPAIIAAAGCAVDLSQAYNVHERLANALDKAALAGGSTSGTQTQVQAQIQKFFNANYTAGHLGTPSPLTISLSNNQIDVQATATVPTVFMGVFGQNSITVSAETIVKTTVAGLELVLVMDNTGSMSQSAGGSVSKISAAQTAATDLLNILFGSNSNVPILFVGVVPFAQAVNVGTGNSGWTTNTTPVWGSASWMGCVEARYSALGQDLGDDTPATAAFPQYDAGCNTSLNPWFGNNTTNPKHDNCSTTGANFGYQSPLSLTLGPNAYCSQAMLPMTNTESPILTAINSMTANGDTLQQVGLAWGWRMLSPKWRGLWGGTMNANSLPLDYNTQGMNKVVILMTDGDNNVTVGNYTAYGFLSQGELGGNTTTAGALTWSNTQEQTLCTNMKANNILIYTIALGSSVSSTAQTVLSKCATGPAYYFLSPTTSELDGIFTTIANQLNTLHISK